MLRENARELTASDLGCSEDEFCNFMIDMWELKNKLTEADYNGILTIMPKNGEDVITVTVIGDHFYKK